MAVTTPQIWLSPPLRCGAHRARRGQILAAQIVTPKLSPDELVKMVAAKFEIDVAGKSKADILKDFESYLFTLSAQGRRALLLVDEAQNLPLETIEELRMLSNFQQKGKPLLQSFLLGQEELQPILRAPNMEQFRQRIVASCHLAPLTDEETQKYIDYRLAQAGWNGAQLFSEAAFTTIHQFTRGIPRKINTLLDRTLLYGYLEELDVFSDESVKIVVEEVKAEMFVPENKSAAADNAATESEQTESEPNADNNSDNGNAAASDSPKRDIVFARWMGFLRGHYLKMPLPVLLMHTCHKIYVSAVESFSGVKAKP